MFSFRGPRPAKPSEAEELRQKFVKEYGEISHLIGAMRKPLPTQTGDGTYIQEPAEFSLTNDVLDLVKHLKLADYKTIGEAVKGAITGAPIDDRTYFMERFIKVAAELTPNAPDTTWLTNKLTSGLWNDLQHPPQSYLDDRFAYRQADGSCNSLLFPDVGKAKTPYARTVQPRMVMPGALPDPGLIFDAVMARKSQQDHPNQVSSFLFYFASIIIHDLFRTDHHDHKISNTSSYLDLSPLYGSDQDEQDQMRTFKEGKIKPDCFSESRILGFPPGVGCFLIMFNRFHNYVVEQLALINQGGQFTKPREGQSDKKYDNDLFQTGRLITCGLYINIIFNDYIRTILNLNVTDTNWQLNVRDNIPGTARGVGNQVSAEFNLIYRWHSALSERDQKWTENFWGKLFDGKDPEDVPLYGPNGVLATLARLEENIPQDPLQRDIDGMKRGADNKLNDDELVERIVSSVDDCAGAFGAQRVPTVLKSIEVLGMMQAREWNVASLNEFRKYFGLKPHATFEDINPDPEVASALKHLYDEPDFVELYPGLVAEDAKEVLSPGCGLCPSFTVSRAILSDAATLVRGDRFYTIDYHPRKLTNWGFAEQNSDTKVDNGCVLYKLFLRAFPDHFEPNSVYAHYPFTVPPKMKSVLGEIKKAHLYNFERPQRIPQPPMIFSYRAAQDVLNDQKTFNVTWGKAIEVLMGPTSKNFMLAGDGPTNTQSRDLMGKALYIDNWPAEVKTFYEMITRKLLKQKSYRLGKVNQVDIIRDVGNLAHVHFCAGIFMLPLKTEESPHGIFDEQQLYMIMSLVFMFIFLDLDPANSFALQQAASQVTKMLGELVEANVTAINDSGILSSLMQLIQPQATQLRDYGIHMIKRLLDSGITPHDLVWSNLLPTAGGMVSNQGQLLGQSLDYFLHEGASHLPEINRLAKLDTPEADTTLLHYMMEGSRLASEVGVFRRAAHATTLHDTIPAAFSPTHAPQPVTHDLPAGAKFFVNLHAASRDPAAFPDPDTLRLNRPLDSYIHLGAGPHQCLGLPIVRISLTAMLKVIGALDGLRPAPGPQGRVAKVDKGFGFHAYLSEDAGTYFPFPCSLKVNWDGDLP